MSIPYEVAKASFDLHKGNTLTVTPFLTDSCEVILRETRGYIIGVTTLHNKHPNVVQFHKEDKLIIINGLQVDATGLPIDTVDKIIESIGKIMKRHMN